MSTPSTPSTPPNPGAVIGSPIPTVTYGSGGSFTVSCSSRIATTPRDCLDVITTASEYPTWNRFCRKCTIDAQQPGEGGHDDPSKLHLGTQFTFDVHLNPDEPVGGGGGRAGRPTALEVSVLEAFDEDADGGVFTPEPSPAEGRRKGWRIAWRQRPSLLMPAWMLRCERVQEFVEVNGGSETLYLCWETFYGVLAPVVRAAVAKQVQKGFDVWLLGLKERAEKRGQALA